MENKQNYKTYTWDGPGTPQYITQADQDFHLQVIMMPDLSPVHKG